MTDSQHLTPPSLAKTRTPGEEPVRGDRRLPKELKAAAVRLFQLRGYSAVTIDDIVREVGVTKGGFYHYFASKGELLFELHTEYVTYSVDEYTRVLTAATGPAERLDAFVHEAFRQIHEFREHVDVLFDERRYLPSERVAEVEGKKDELRLMLVDVIEEGIVKGIFRPIDSHAGALAVLGMCMWGYQWYRRDGVLSHGEIADQFSSILQRGLAA